jgi:iron complex outermembrane recepter protein
MNLRLKFLIGTALSCVAIPACAQDVVPSQRDEGASGEIVVTGIRKSLQDAIETKRRADSIVDVISAEDVGKLADSNVAESLARLPGVTVDHQFGEGEQLSIAS